MGFCLSAELVHADLSARDAVLCFSWSRMCVHDAESLRGQVKEETLLTLTRALTQARF